MPNSCSLSRRFALLAGSLVFFTAGQALAAPYSGTAITVPATIQAEHFDTGGQRVSYYDTTSGNLGGVFRTGEAVDIISAPSTIGGHVVTNMDTSEWMVYSFRVATSGNYDIDVRTSSTLSNSAYRIDIDGKAAIGAVTAPNTGSLNSYQWTSKRRVWLAAGGHSMTVVSDRGGFRLDAIRVTSATAAAPAPAPAPAPTSSARLLFKSGFDGGSLSAPPPTHCWGTGCWQDIVGLDSLTGFTWPGVIAGGTSKVFHLTTPLTTTSQNIGNYSLGRIDFLTGPRGAQSSALMQQISRNVNGTAPMGNAPAQNALQFMPKHDPGDTYISYWLKLQPDLMQKMTNLPAGPGIAGGGTWRAIFGLKTGSQTSWGDPADNGDYRIEAYVMTNNNAQPYWVLLGDNNAGGGAPVRNTFRVENRNVPVPVGQWFKVEFFWHRSTGSDGRVWMAVNGKVVADRRGANIGAWNLPINRIMAPLLYSGSAMPIYQWVDDVEIWNGFPPAGSNPPYAPH